MTKDISRSKKKRVLAKTNNRCGYCGVGLHGLNRHFDHIVPRSKGGNRKDENLIAACRFCNISKGTKTVEEFRLSQSLRASGHEIKFSGAQLAWLDEQGALEDLLGDAYYHTFYFEHAGVSSQGVTA